MRAWSRPIIAAVDGICAGAGAIIAMALRHARLAATGAKVAFTVQHGGGLAGFATWAPAANPASSVHRPTAGMSELLVVPALRGHDRRRDRALGLLVLRPPRASEHLLRRRRGFACRADFRGALPTSRQRRLSMRMLAMEWAMSAVEAIEAEAISAEGALQRPAADFARAFEALPFKVKPAFQGN